MTSHLEEDLYFLLTTGYGADVTITPLRSHHNSNSSSTTTGDNISTASTATAATVAAAATAAATPATAPTAAAESAVFRCHRFVLEEFATEFLQDYENFAFLGDIEEKIGELSIVSSEKSPSLTPLSAYKYELFTNAVAIKIFLEYVYCVVIKGFGHYPASDVAHYQKLCAHYLPPGFHAGEHRRLVRSLNNKANSDIKLKVDDTIFYAHKALLYARSSYFRAMFSSGMQEATEGVLTLRQTTKEAVLAILEYIYLNKVQVDASIVVDVLVLSDRLSFNHLKFEVQNTISSALSVDNVCDITVMALTYTATVLFTSCVNFITANLNEVVKTDGFDALDDRTIDAVAGLLTKHLLKDVQRDAAMYVSEVLSLLQMFKKRRGVTFTSTVLSEFFALLGTSMVENKKYTSSIRSDLIKDKMRQNGLKFQEEYHPVAFVSQKYSKDYAGDIPKFTTYTMRVALAAGTDIAHMMKCLIFSYRDIAGSVQMVLVLACGDARIDEKKLTSYLSSADYSIKDLRLANEELIYPKYGSSAVMKLIPPCGFRKPIKTIVDVHVMELDYFYVPSGKSSELWKMTPETLMKLLGISGVKPALVDVQGKFDSFSQLYNTNYKTSNNSNNNNNSTSNNNNNSTNNNNNNSSNNNNA